MTDKEKVLNEIINSLPIDTTEGFKNLNEVEKELHKKEISHSEKIKEKINNSKYILIDTEYGKVPINNVPLDLRVQFYQYDDKGNLRFKKDGKTPLQKKGRRKDNFKIENPFEVHNAVAQYRKAGVMYANVLFGLSCQMGGETFKPSNEEREYIEDSTTAYLQEKGIDDLPPVLALTLSVTTYFISRKIFRTTIIKAKSIIIKKSIFQTIKDKFFSKKETENNGSYSNNGNDGHRKDKSGETAV